MRLALHWTPLVAGVIAFAPGSDVWADSCESIEYGWTITLGGVDCDYGHAVAVDVVGNIYWAGTFADTVDFDPSDEGTDYRTSLGTKDVFLMKLSPEGVPLWTHTFGSSEYSETADGIALDEEGYIILTGRFGGQVDFDPGIDVDFRESNGGHDVFVSKFMFDGQYQWTQIFGGMEAEGVTQPTIDQDGNIILLGSFVGIVDFNPADTEEYIKESEGGDDLFIMTLDPDGDYMEVLTLGGASCESSFSPIAIDSLGDLYVAGNFQETVDFDLSENEVQERTSFGDYDFFILKLSADRSFEWVLTAGTTGYDDLRKISLLDDRSLIYSGIFTDSSFIDFDPTFGIDERTSIGSSDAFVTRIGVDGSYSWTWSAGGELWDSALWIDVEEEGGVFVTGRFGQEGYADYQVDFDQAGAGDFHDTVANADFFTTRLEAGGSYGWTYTAGGTQYDSVHSTSVADGSIFITGFYGGNCDFDPTASLDRRSSAGNADMFLTKWTCAEHDSCEGDANGDQFVDPLDAGFILSRFGCTVGVGDGECDQADVNLDGVVDPLDSGFVFSRFGLCQ